MQGPVLAVRADRASTWPGSKPVSGASDPASALCAMRYVSVVGCLADLIYTAGKPPPGLSTKGGLGRTLTMTQVLVPQFPF